MNSSCRVPLLLCLALVGCDEGAPSAADDAGDGGPLVQDAGRGSDGEVSDSEVAQPAEPLLRRLTDWEVRQSVADLLGISPEAIELPRDRLSQGFSNTAEGVVTSAAHVEGWFLSAQQITRAIPDPEAFFAQWGECDEPRPPCTEAFIAGVGARVFRRPVTSDEISAYAAIFDAAESEGLSFVEAGPFVLEAMLQSPAFLYRVQPPPGERTQAYAMAEKLAFFITASTPDRELLEAAARGELRSEDEVRAAAERLLSGPHALRGLRRFTGDWLRIGWLDAIVLGERDLYDRAPEIQASAFAMIDDHAEGRPFLDLLVTDEVEINPGIAPYYRQALPMGAPPEPIDTSMLSDRTGILTHPAFLAGMSGFTGESLVQRGVFLLGALYCQEPTSPPAALNVTDFLAHLPESATERDYSEDRLERAACAGCHQGFDPLAFALEPYDTRGRFNDVNEAGRRLRTDGRLTTPDGVLTFETPDEFVRLVRQQEPIQRCVTRKLVQFAIGRVPTREEEALVDHIHDQAYAAGGDYRSLVLEVVSSPLFRGAEEAK